MPLFHFPDSGFFRTDRSSRVMAGLIVVVTAILYAYSRRYPASNRSQRILRCTPDQSGPSTRSPASALCRESMA